MIPQDLIIEHTIPAMKFPNGRRMREKVLHWFTYSGYKILDKIGQDEKILDIGCGWNLFKSHRPNLIGIDPNFDEADIKIAFQDFETTEKFDVILCLGSLHFGELEDIKFLVKKLTGMIKPGGRVFWRCAKQSVIWYRFAWTKQLHYDFAKEFDYTIIELEDEYMLNKNLDPNFDENLTTAQPEKTSKIYAQWVKN